MRPKLFTTHPRLTRAFGDYGGIASGNPAEVTPTKIWGIRGIGMDAAGNLYVAMSEMPECTDSKPPRMKVESSAFFLVSFQA